MRTDVVTAILRQQDGIRNASAPSLARQIEGFACFDIFLTNTYILQQFLERKTHSWLMVSQSHVADLE